MINNTGLLWKLEVTLTKGKNWRHECQALLKKIHLYLLMFLIFLFGIYEIIFSKRRKSFVFPFLFCRDTSHSCGSSCCLHWAARTCTSGQINLQSSVLGELCVFGFTYRDPYIPTPRLYLVWLKLYCQMKANIRHY